MDKLPIGGYFSNVIEPEPPSQSLAGSLVIAHPGLEEPSFRHSVLILPDYHPQNGSFGLIINRPMGKLVGDVLKQKAPHLAMVPVMQGGPVGSDELLFAAFRWRPEKRMIECRHHISLEEADQLALSPQHTVRAFIGYAGWTGGQLENELTTHSWLVRRAEFPEILEIENAPQMWKNLTSGFGPWFKLSAEAPDNPTLN